MLTKLKGPEDWQPLEINIYNHDLEYSYDPEISEVPEYCRASGKKKFHGYSSEPPIAPAFREETPVGLATPALRALATMHSLLEFDGEEEKIPMVNNAFCAMWGINPEDLAAMDTLKPDIRNRSEMDMLKSARNKTHRLYGYENEQNYVTVSGGKYQHDTVNDKRYIDWHRIFLTLRYIGTFLVASDDLGREVLKGVNTTLYYGLNTREFPRIFKCPNFPNLAPMKVTPVKSMLSDALQYALQFYSSEKVVNAIAHRNLLRTSQTIVPEDLEFTNITLATFRSVLNKSKKVLQISWSRNDEAAYDIMEPSGREHTGTFETKMNKLQIVHNISMYRAVELFLLAKLIKNWRQKSFSSMRTIKDMLRAPTQLTEDQRMKVIFEISEFMGVGAGDMIWRLLRRFREEKSRAETDFVTYCLDMCLDYRVELVSNKTTLFWTCARAPTAFKPIVRVFLSAWNKTTQFFNVPNLPALPHNAMLKPNEEFQYIMQHLWTRKKAYWIGHYNQRKEQTAEFLLTVPKDNWGERTKVVANVVRYQWLVTWLAKYQAKVTNELEVWPEISNQVAISLLVNTQASYCNKRSIQSQELIPYNLEHYKNFARRIDIILKPQIKFSLLVKIVHQTAKEMSRDIAKVVKILTEPNDIFESADPLGKLFDDQMKAQVLEQTKDDWITDAIDEIDPALLHFEDFQNLIPVHDSNAFLKSYVAQKYRERNLEMERAFKDEPGEIFPSERIAPLMTERLIPDPDDEEEMNAEAELEDMDDFEFGEEFGDMEDMEFGEMGKELEFGFSNEEAIEAKGLAVSSRKSPITHMYEVYEKIPDTLTWSQVAKVDIKKLDICYADEFDEIVRVGEDLLKLVREERKEDGYDVS